MPLPPCSSCQFWDRKQSHYSRGLCRRYVPKPSLSSEARWPLTEPNDGCGEHRPIETNEAPIPYGSIFDRSLTGGLPGGPITDNPTTNGPVA